MISGGGTGTFVADLDNDGDIDGSAFGFVVIVRGGGSASGHFTCLMAGQGDIFGLHLMSVEGQVGAASTAGTPTFSGKGTLHVNGDKTPVTFHVDVLAEGGAGVGQFQLTVKDANDVTLVAAFPPETVASGQIDIR